MSTSPYISVMTTTRAYTSIREMLVMLVMEEQVRAFNSLTWVGAALVRLLCGQLPWRCPESPARQVKLTKPLILQYPDKIGHAIWSPFQFQFVRSVKTAGSHFMPETGGRYGG